MPKTTQSGQPRQEELPGTLRRSPEEAQETFAKAHDSAIQTYGEGERAYRVAYGALKHKFEKVGDHWEKKQGLPSGRTHAAGTAGSPLAREPEQQTQPGGYRARTAPWPGPRGVVAPRRPAGVVPEAGGKRYSRARGPGTRTRARGGRR